MSDTTLLTPEPSPEPPAEVKAVIERAAQIPGRVVEYEPLPPDVTFKHEEIGLKHPTFVGSVMLMVFFSLITFFVPLVNGVIGGSIGAYYAAHRKRAWIAAALNAVLVPVFIGVLTYMSEQPGLTFLAGLTFREWVALHILGTILGAVMGMESRPYDTEGRFYRYV